MLSKKQRLRGLKASLTLPYLDSFPMTIESGASSIGAGSTSETMPVNDWERDLALAEQARREAVYEARDAEGDRPSALPSLPPARAPQETLPDGTPVTWPRVILAVALAVSALAGAASQWLGGSTKAPTPELPRPAK